MIGENSLQLYCRYLCRINNQSHPVAHQQSVLSHAITAPLAPNLHAREHLHVRDARFYFILSTFMDRMIVSYNLSVG